MSDLKPCPFCDGEASDGLDDIRECWYVECSICGASFESKTSSQRAIVGWNNRVKQKCIHELVKEYSKSASDDYEASAATPQRKPD